MSIKNDEANAIFGRCGCCLEHGFLVNMWTKIQNKLQMYSEILINCYGISWKTFVSKEHDYICEQCARRLIDAYEFRKMVIKSQKAMKKEFRNANPELKLEEVKIEALDDIEIETMCEKTGLFHESNEKEAFVKEVDLHEILTNTKNVEIIEKQGHRQSKCLKKSSSKERSKLYMENDEKLKKLDHCKKRTNHDASKMYSVQNINIKQEIENGSINNMIKNEKGEKIITKTGGSKMNQVIVSEMTKHKHNIRTIMQYSNATMIKCHTFKGYPCCFCEEVFENLQELKRHNLEIHEDAGNKAIHVKYVTDLIIKLDITGLRCIICGAKVTELEKFIDHLKIKHNKRIHTDIKNYIVPFKFETEKFQCIVCLKQFEYFKLLSEHMNDHYKNFECAVCGRGFINRQSLKTHSYRHQKNIGEFKCPHCLRIFDTRPKRSAHVRRIHLHGGKTRKCHLCSDKFASVYQVNNHMVLVHGAEAQVFKCGACERTYKNVKSLKDHMKRFHLMIKPNKCMYCDMCFCTKIELRTHLVTHTKTKEFQCDVCDKRFGTKCCLNQHMRSHYGKKRYKCAKCDISYMTKSKWKMHMWKKHGELAVDFV